MKFDWQAAARLIMMLSHVAMEWYKLVGANPNGEDERRARKAAAIVIDPDTPEEDPEEVELAV